MASFICPRVDAVICDRGGREDVGGVGYPVAMFIFYAISCCHCSVV